MAALPVVSAAHVILSGVRWRRTMGCHGLCNNFIFFSFYFFVNWWNGNKRSRRPKLEGKLEELFSLPSSHSDGDVSDDDDTYIELNMHQALL